MRCLLWIRRRMLCRQATSESPSGWRERRPELAFSALRAEGDQFADAVAPVAPLLSDRGELVDVAATLRAPNVAVFEPRLVAHGVILSEEDACAG